MIVIFYFNLLLIVFLIVPRTCQNVGSPDGLILTGTNLKRLNDKIDNELTDTSTPAPPPPLPHPLPPAPIPQDRQRSKNYASAECAKVVEANPEAKKSWLIINESIDEYMLNPCKAKIWFVIELCETIQATHIEMANYELFSSTPKEFTVYFSDVYPADDWKLVGSFTAADSRTLQAFDLNQVGFGKFIRVELHSYHGKEHYCPISQVKIYGVSMVDEYENTAKIENQNNLSSLEHQNQTKSKLKPKCKTSAYRVYRNMITEPKFCGLSPSIPPKRSELNSKISILNSQEDPGTGITSLSQNLTLTGNRSAAPLKPSIFVELSNKYKSLEASLNLLRYQNEDIERRLNKTEMKLEQSASFVKNNFKFVVIVVKAFLVYKLMLNLL